MKISSPSRKMSVRNPSHLGSKIHPSPGGSSLTRLASIGRTGGLTARFMSSGGTALIFPDNLFVLTRRQEVGAAPISATGQAPVSMTDDGSVSAVHVAWDVTTSRRQIVNGASSIVIPSNESRRIRD